MADAGTTILVSTHFMDEAERCHELAILDSGVLVASGAPRQLMEQLAARVIEVEAGDGRAVRRALADLAGVQSLAQSGTRLRVLLEREDDEALPRIRGALARAHIDASAERARPTLEDVFVAVTQPTRAFEMSA
jgi:ABC-2 type transport system ATP-binding protein